MSERILSEINQKLSVLISLSVRQLTGETSLVKEGRKRGIGDAANYLAAFGLQAKDIAQILGAPVTSVRTFLTPTRRR